MNAYRIIIFISISILSPHVLYGQQPKHVLKHEIAATNASISPDGKTIAVGYGQAKKTGPVLIWNLANGKELNRFEADDFVISGISHIDDNTLITSSLYDSVKVWDLKNTKTPIHTMTIRSLTHMSSVTLQKVAMYADQKIQLWDFKDPKKPVKSNLTFDRCNHYCFSKNAKSVFTVENEGLTEFIPKVPPMLKYYNAESGKILGEFKVQERNNATAISISPNMEMAVVGYYFGKMNLEIYDLNTKKVVFESDALSCPPRGMAFSSDSKYLLCGDYLGWLLVVDLNKKKVIKVIKDAHEGSINSILYNESNKIFATVSVDNSVKIWTLEDLIK